MWRYDRSLQSLSPIATGDHVMGLPLWTPDGRQVVYTASGASTINLYIRNADGTGDDELLVNGADANRIVAVSWTSSSEGDGRTLVAMKGKRHVLLVSMEDTSVEELPIDAAGLDASISPDGEWIAYSSNRSGAREVYVERFPALSDRRLVSNAGGQQPLWSNDGRELYYLDTDRNRVMVVSVRNDGALELDRPEILIERPLIALGGSDPGHSYDVAPDGRFLMLTPGRDDRNLGGLRDEANREAIQITVVLNWFRELERLAPTGN